MSVPILDRTMKSSSYFYAGVVAVAALNVSAHDYETKRADSHAPSAVMGDHTHKTGEIMLSYRYTSIYS